MDKIRRIFTMKFQFLDFITLICILLSISFKTTEGSWWLLGTDMKYHHHPNFFMNDMDPENYENHCDNFPYFTLHQKHLCRQSSGKLLSTISAGAKLGIDECQFGLQSHRWNCSIVQEATNVFGQVLSIQSREKAYVHAISAASLAFEITKACARGELDKCSCDERVRSRNTKGKWQWGGCSEDVKYGTDLSKSFADSIENSTTAEGLMNLHNNEAGRRLLKSSMNMTCKCHGVSGSCTMKVCWRVLSNFRTIGEKVGEKFEGAFRMQGILREISNEVNGGSGGKKFTRSNKHNSNDYEIKHHFHQHHPHSSSTSGGTSSKNLSPEFRVLRLKPYYKHMKRPTKKDLVFIDESPDYCDRNNTFDVLGTKGRICNKTSDGPEGCRLLCCGRGYQTMLREGIESCNCQFVWCCRVQCESCPFKRDEYICN